MEKSLEDYPSIITIKKTKIIIDQIEKSICKIYCKDGSQGTGFFCYIKNKKGKKYRVLITNNHIIGHNQINEKQKLTISFNNEKEIEELNLDANKNIYTNKDYDITIIELKEKEFNNKLFLEIDDRVYLENSKNMFNKKSVYIIQYPKEHGASVSYGIIKRINEKNGIEHLCHTSQGSSGSPIINLDNNKVLAVHYSAMENRNFNKGTFLNAPINDFLNIFDEVEFDLKKKMTIHNNNLNIMNLNNFSINETTLNTNQSVIIDNDNIEINKNEIEITLEIQKCDVNKEIYFLSNNKENDKFPNYLNELNSENTELLIGETKKKYEKHFKPTKKGIYEIILKFQNYFKNCSYMFSSCKQIIRIDLSNFKTKEVTDMSYMFYFCTNLKELNLSNLNTENVKNMSNMFSNCSKLSIINASSFNIKNVNNMTQMFLNCRNLSNIDFSSFIASHDLDISNILEGCWNIKKIKLNRYSKGKFQKEFIDKDVKIEYV